MTKLLLRCVLCSCIAAALAAVAARAEPFGKRSPLATLFAAAPPRGDAALLTVAASDDPQEAHILQKPAIRRDGDIVAAWATKISVAGAILLTADRVFRSMDSVLETMHLERADGTRLELGMDVPAGVGLAVTLSRPLGF